ncbi:hypothetical protein ACIP2Y_28425 [Streptomyces sviceus]|uniref:hypothetical protein n=1 Tax=Streptomyces sviceus TaxID=285530 RepID=UPI0038000B84
MTHPTAIRLAGVSIELSHLITGAVALSGLAVLAGGWLVLRRGARAGRVRSSAPAVWVAALAALGCTAYSADTSWRFAADYLDMAGTAERAAMFGAAELALFATALMARQNLTIQGAPGLPGILVWMITGVQVIPAYAESGPVGGTVRAFVGPVMAAMLWHQAMGIELRLRKPGAASHGILAVLGREARERLLSRLGIAERDRDAAQITRDRATARAVTLATRLAGRSPKQGDSWRSRWIARRLESALGRSGVGSDPQQLRMLLNQLAARRHATALATIDLPSPWTQPSPGADHTPLGRPALDGTAAGDQTSQPRTVPDADTAPAGDGPHGDRPDQVAGTAPAQNGDQEEHPVPDIDATGDRADAGGDRDHGDEDYEAGDHGDRRIDGDKTAAQSADSSSLTPVPTTRDRGAPDSDTGTEPAENRPRPVPDDRDGDPADSGSETGTDPTGDRPHAVPTRRRPKATRNRSRGGQGKPSLKQPRPSVDQLVAQLRPHVPGLLERDGNAEVTRTQLREIMRAHNIGIRNDRLTPVLERLRRETATSTTKKRSAR